MRLAAGLPPRPLHRTVESALGGHDDPLGDIQEHGVLRGAERAPGTAPPAPRLLPNDLSPHQHAEIILEDAITSADKSIGLAPEVGIDRHSSPRLELSETDGESIREHLEILDIGIGNVTCSEVCRIPCLRSKGVR